MGLRHLTPCHPKRRLALPGESAQAVGGDPQPRVALLQQQALGADQRLRPERQTLGIGRFGDAGAQAGA